MPVPVLMVSPPPVQLDGEDAPRGTTPSPFIRSSGRSAQLVADGHHRARAASTTTNATPPPQSSVASPTPTRSAPHGSSSSGPMSGSSSGRSERLRSYRQLNSGKWNVVAAMEQRLPPSPWYRAEWAALG